MSIKLKRASTATIQAVGCLDTGDLEAGTATIVPTSRPAIAAAQYSYTGTLTKLNLPGLVVKCLNSRLNVTIGTLGTATHLYLSVRVDVDDTDHEIFNEDWNSAGNKLDAVDISAAFKPAVLSLIDNGLSHTYYFMFWADTANQVTVTVVEGWMGHGSRGTTDTVASPAPTILEFTANGQGWVHVKMTRIGTGNIYVGAREPSDSARGALFYSASTGAGTTPSFIFSGQILGKAALVVVETVATDLVYIEYARTSHVRRRGVRGKHVLWEPGCKDTGDLEGATKTISATSEAVGLVNADYVSADLTLTMPSDARLVVDRIAARTALTIDSISAGANLKCRTYVDVQDANHLLFDESYGTTGAKADEVDTHAANKAVIFNLLADGATHKLYTFLWKDAAGVGNTVVSLVETWYGVASNNNVNTFASPAPKVAHVVHRGVLYYGFYFSRNDGVAGTGTANLANGDIDQTYLNINQGTGGATGRFQGNLFLSNGMSIFSTQMSVATDFTCLNKMYIDFEESDGV